MSESEPGRSRRERLVSALELVAGAAVVVGHNVLRVLPNEVPILVVAALVSSRLRDGGCGALGFRRPASWPRTILLGAGAAALRIALAAIVVDPLTARVWPPAVAPEGAHEITGNLGYALLALVVVWLFAAFGEEITYRGYLQRRAADVVGGSTVATVVAVVVSSVLFGLGHFYKGPAGMVDSGVAGLVLGTVYVISGRNLWPCILAHGLIDTVGVVALYFGFDT